MANKAWTVTCRSNTCTNRILHTSGSVITSFNREFMVNPGAWHSAT